MSVVDVAVVFRLDFNERRLLGIVLFKALVLKQCFPGHAGKKKKKVCHGGTEISKMLSICLFYSALGGTFSLYFKLYFEYMNRLYFKCLAFVEPTLIIHYQVLLGQLLFLMRVCYTG